MSGKVWKIEKNFRETHWIWENRRNFVKFEKIEEIPFNLKKLHGKTIKFEKMATKVIDFGKFVNENHWDWTNDGKDSKVYG